MAQRQKFIVAICATSLFVCFTLFKLPIENIHQFQFLNRFNKDNLIKKQILFIGKWSQTIPTYPFLDIANERCAKCNFVHGETLLNSSDAVVLRGRILPDPKHFREIRKPEQKWIFLEREVTVNNQLSKYGNFFHWTMTHRRSSDIFWPYGRFISYNESYLPSSNETWAFMPFEGQEHRQLTTPTIEDLRNKSLVAWIVSNCKANNKRELLAEELGKFIPVDIYGSCSKLNCTVPRGKSSSGGNECRAQISQKYKFYLAFENSLCENYVTEKFFDTLLTNMVAIVYGGADYSKFPLNSYINVMDFDTVKDLADYLLYLDKNPEEYLKYFEWRKYFWVSNNAFVLGACDLCNKLWDDGKTEVNLYKNINEWWLYKNVSKEKGSMSKTKTRLCYSYKSVKIFKSIKVIDKNKKVA